MNALFYWIFFTGPFLLSTEKIYTTGFWLFENYQTISHRYYITVSSITLIVLQITLIILLRFRMGSFIHLFMDRKIQKNIYKMNDLLSDTYHSHKNLIFSINILAKQAIREYGGEKCKETLNRIQQITSLSLCKTSEMLDTLREIRYQFKRNNLYQVIDEAIKKVCIPPNISIVWKYEKNAENSTICCFDYYHINKVFINIFNNSIEAIEIAKRKKGTIEINISFQFQWIIIIIKDNGIGIKDKKLKKCNSHYYSDKKTRYNWGLGLSYIFKVIKAHLGYIWIESKYKEFTSINIMLPRS
jgi:signal transduction histidine kinase